MPDTDNTSITITIEVPTGAALYFFESGIRAALRQMHKARTFMEDAGCEEQTESIEEATLAMTALKQAVHAAQTEDVERQIAAKQSSGGVRASIVPTVGQDRE